MDSGPFGFGPFGLGPFAFGHFAFETLKVGPFKVGPFEFGSFAFGMNSCDVGVSLQICPVFYFFIFVFKLLTVPHHDRGYGQHENNMQVL